MEGFVVSKLFLSVLLVGALILVGCTQQASSGSQTTVLEDGTMVKPDGTMIKPDGTIVNPDGTMTEPTDSGNAQTDSESPYVPFSQAAFDAAKASGKKIFLNFYANWCPICKAAEPKVTGGFAQCNNSDIVGFQVNYNDNQTDADELALAQTYNVTYQHTYVYVDSDGQSVLFKQSGANWSETELANQLSCA